MPDAYDELKKFLALSLYSLPMQKVSQWPSGTFEPENIIEVEGVQWGYSPVLESILRKVINGEE